MLIMLEAGRAFGADPALAKQYRSLLDTCCLLYTSRCV